jgi:uncharacterized Zn finger protein
MCNHKKHKIIEVLFNKFGKKTAVLVCCLKCGFENKVLIKIKNHEKSRLRISQRPKTAN